MFLRKPIHKIHIPIIHRYRNFYFFWTSIELLKLSDLSAMAITINLLTFTYKVASFAIIKVFLRRLDLKLVAQKRQ